MTVFWFNTCSTFILFHIYLASPATAQHQARWATYSAAVFFIFNDFYHTNCLKIYRTDLHQIFRVGRTGATDEISFSIPQGRLPWHPISLGFCPQTNFR